MGLCAEQNSIIFYSVNFTLMKEIIVLVLISFSLLKPSQSFAQALTNEKVLVGVFDGRTPCNELAGQINEKVTAECIKIKWRLTLYSDSMNGHQGEYELIGFVYKKNTPRLGKWSIRKGTKADPQATVYQLEIAGRATLFLLKGDENVLFFLDQELKLLVGNKDFSYTLNRIEKKL